MAMNVTKFFRKYNKTMLVVFTIFLMVAFLVPTTLKEVFQTSPGKRVVGTAFGDKIRISDIQQIDHEIGVLDILNRAIYSSAQNPREARPFNWLAFMQFTPENQREIYYYLLVREARNAGIQVSDDQVDRALAERGIPAQLVNSILKNAQISLQGFRQAIANYLAVEGYFDMVASNVKVSEPELEHMFKLMYNRMVADIVALPAANFIQQVPQPSDKDLAAYFNEHKKDFAYPDRVQVEFLKADMNAIKDSIKISKERAKQYWELHRAEFTITTQPATPKGTTKPATQQAPIQVEMPMEQALPKVVDKLKAEKAYDIAIQAMTDVKRRSADQWRTSPIDKSGVRQKVSDYQKLAEQASKQFAAKITYNRTPLVSAQEAAELPGIGSAFIPGQPPVQFAQYAFQVKPLVQPPPQKAQETLYLEPFQDAAILLRQMGDDGKETALYLFRVIKVDPAHAPTSLDEVKAKVIEEYRLNQAFAIAKQNAQKICQKAGKAKLSDLVAKPTPELAKIFKQIGVKKITSDTFSRRQFSYGGQLAPPSLSSVQGDTAEFADLAFDKLWSQPTTQPSGQRTCTTIDISKDRTAYAVQFIEKKPALANEFKQFKSFLARFALMSKQQEFIQSWFGPQNIQKRTAYTPTTVEDATF